MLTRNDEGKHAQLLAWEIEGLSESDHTRGRGNTPAIRCGRPCLSQRLRAIRKLARWDGAGRNSRGITYREGERFFTDSAAHSSHGEMTAVTDKGGNTTYPSNDRPAHTTTEAGGPQRPSTLTSDSPKPRVEPERASIYWIHEAITYLGLDRLGLNKPEQAIYRMVRKGILRPRKIGRYLAFTKSDLDYVITNGERKRTPGRPRTFEK